MSSVVEDPSEPDSLEEAALDVLHLLPKGRAAVLGAEEITYNGHIKPEAGVCWVSFPGKFKSGWDALVAEKHGDSVACVFLCQAADGLGQHEKDPESKDGRCFCSRIYGERDYKTFGYLHDIKKPRSKCTEKEIDMIYQKATAMNAAVVFADDSPDVKEQRKQVAQQLWADSNKTAAWGCRWYAVWLERVEEAVRLKQRLKVVFFPNEVEKGLVQMKDLPLLSSNLWDGKGCGGSQKCEIATLKAKGWDYEGVDVSSFLKAQFNKGDMVEALDGAYWRKGPILEVNVEEVRWRVRCNFSSKEFWTDHVRPSEADDLLKAIGGSTRELEDALQAFDLKVVCCREARLRDGKASVGMKVEINSIKQVHKLRDSVLSGDLDRCLNAAIAKMDPSCQELVVEKREFFDFYESTILSFTEFTPHQLEKLKEMESANTDLHLQAPAGAGKTFVAVQYMSRMMRVSPTSTLCYVAPNRALVFFVLRWLVLLAPSKMSSILSKITVMHAPYKGFWYPIVDGPRISLKPVKKPEMSLLVIDEAHKVSAEQASVWKLPAKQRLVLSDLSQSRKLHHLFPDIHRVQLSEVIRGSQRITAAARTFQLSEAARSVAAVGTDGPPVKTYIFEAGKGTDPLDEYISHTIKALWYVVETLPSGLSLHGRVALLVPDESFRRKLEAPLQKRLEEEFSPRNIRLKSFQDFWELLPAHLVPSTNVEGSQEFIILDSRENSIGLEHLVVICVGMDEVVGATDQETRARLYVGITRAQLLAIVVNEFLPGSWLEFVTTLRLNKRFQKRLASAEVRKRAATEVAVLPAAAPQLAAKEQCLRGTCVWDTDENTIRTKTTKLLFDPQLCVVGSSPSAKAQAKSLVLASGDVWALDLKAAAERGLASRSWSGSNSGPQDGLQARDVITQRSTIPRAASNAYVLASGDVWALDLKAVMEWKQLLWAPSERSEHSAIYDLESHSMVIFGGSDGPTSQLADWRADSFSVLEALGDCGAVWALDLKAAAERGLASRYDIAQFLGHGVEGTPAHRKGSRQLCVVGSSPSAKAKTDSQVLASGDVWALDLKADVMPRFPDVQTSKGHEVEATPAKRNVSKRETSALSDLRELTVFQFSRRCLGTGPQGSNRARAADVGGHGVEAIPAKRTADSFSVLEALCDCDRLPACLCGSRRCVGIGAGGIFFVAWGI
ncbi:unnamed protein product, partial [Symbiodinium necroappetens]